VTDMSRACPCAVMDPHQIKQAALNLLRNALEAMPGGGRLTLATDVEPDGSVVLNVTDTGPGIANEIRDQLFDPFFTTKATGTGLGLSLAAHIVREHDGFIAVENERGGGARFTLRLPPTRAEAGACACDGPVPAPLAAAQVVA
jgi:two-component system, NtrC family, sensor kinase